MGRFDFKRFSVDDHGCGMKVGTDSVLLGAWADLPDKADIIDLGAGSGLLALMVAQRSDDARVTAIEIDADAVEAARRNVEASPWASRIDVVRADALTYTPDRPVDMIISNPPYFTGRLVAPDARRALARHTNGSLGAASVLTLASRWLGDDGSVAMITPADGADELIYEAEMLRLKLRRRCMVSTVAGRPPTRVLWQFARRDLGVDNTSLAIRDSGAYTPEYTGLTHDFYLTM